MPGFPILKRLIDLILVIPGLILISPILALVAVICRITQGSPILFQQKRPGYHGKIFTLYKFRTMCTPSRMDGVPLPDSRRMTRLGRFLRSTSLDELPELFNILKGDMSLVGPRPLLIAYLSRYSTEQARRHDVMPGLTGWAQVNGRNALSWEDKFQLDLWYVDHWSVWLDIEILFLTFWKVIQREGITPVGEVDVEEFKGNQG
jgi:sugar transferase EpsL